MNAADPNPDEWGITSRYLDADGKWQTVSEKTQAAIRTAMGGDPAGAKENALRVMEPGDSRGLSEPAELKLEDGTMLRLEKKFPQDLPFGYHELTGLRSGNKTRLIIGPGKCFLPKSLRAWGWAVQLYALRSKKSWGMGDFADLRTFSRRAARELNCDFVLANPCGASIPVLPQQASPYYPSSRRFLNPLYLRVEEIPGAADVKIPLDQLAAAGRALNESRLIGRDAVFKLKLAAFRKIWSRFERHPRFEAFKKAQGKPLVEFSTFCALAEHFQSGWLKWPKAYQHPNLPAVREFQQKQHEQIQFHQWLQWLADQQLTAASRHLMIMTDLPIGVDPGGADAWVWQDLLAQGVSVGAPPDAFNARGQNWGLPPFIPHRLRESGYEPFRQVIQAALCRGGGLRIDHVMGLFRLFWIPENAPPGAGAFVQYRSRELLAILAIESQRVKALVVGEDLGTVAPAMRVELRRRKILSYRLLWFENRPLKKFPRQALSAVSTHDLFTIAGLWNGSDLAAQHKLGLKTNDAGTEKTLQRLRRRIRAKKNTTAAEAVAKTYQLLSKADSMLLTASLDDALAVEERPNLPGTVSEWPNWSIALPEPLENIIKQPLVRQISKILRRPHKKGRP